MEEAAALLLHPPTQITPASPIGAATTPGGAHMTLSTILIGILPSVFFGVPRHSTWPDGPLPERRARGTGIPGCAPFRRCHGGLLSFGDVGLVQEA